MNPNTLKSGNAQDMRATRTEASRYIQHNRVSARRYRCLIRHLPGRDRVVDDFTDLVFTRVTLENAIYYQTPQGAVSDTDVPIDGYLHEIRKKCIR